MTYTRQDELVVVMSGLITNYISHWNQRQKCKTSQMRYWIKRRRESSKIAGARDDVPRQLKMCHLGTRQWSEQSERINDTRSIRPTATAREMHNSKRMHAVNSPSNVMILHYMYAPRLQRRDNEDEDTVYVKRKYDTNNVHNIYIYIKHFIQAYT
jgi:hypothetical protein